MGDYSINGQGTAGNVIAALASFFVPGLGQLLQGRPWLAPVSYTHLTLPTIYSV